MARRQGIACNAGDVEMWALSLGREDPLEEEMASLGNPMDRGAWGATVHGVTESQMQLSVDQESSVK